MDDAIKSYDRATICHPQMTSAFSNKLMLLNYTNDYSPSFVFKEHARFGKLIAGSNNREGRTLCVTHLSQGEKLRIGYVSPDFGTFGCLLFSSTLN